MFGLFRKRHTAGLVMVRQAPPLPAQIRDKTTWTALRDRTRAELEERLVQALSDSEPIIAATETDLSAIDQLWDRVDGALHKIQRSLERGWDRLQVDQRALHEELTELELAFEAGRRQARAGAAQAMMQFALHRDARTRHCGACGGGLASILVGQAQNIECPRCHTPQTVEPGQAFRVFAAAGARWVGEWDAFPHYQVMKCAQVRIECYRHTKDVPMTLLREFHSAARAYWHTAIGVEAHLVPHLRLHVENLVTARMKRARRLLSEHWQWRAYEAARDTAS